MIAVFKKELRQFFSGLPGYITLGVFLLVMGIVVFVLPERNLLDEGYASLGIFFESAPFVMLFVVPAITMRSFSEEYRNGSFEILRTAPLTAAQLVTGKFLASLAVILIALLCTTVYVYTLLVLSTAGIDAGGIVGSYVGLFLLCSVFTAIGIFTSGLQQNAVISFLLSALFSYIIYFLFSSLANTEGIKNTYGYLVSQMGIKSHYDNISKGFIDTRDLVYFLSLVYLFLHATVVRIKTK